MARIAFQFARLYIEASTRNDEVNEILTNFEQKLNDIIVKVQREENQNKELRLAIAESNLFTEN